MMSSGCVSLSSAQRADTLGRGHLQVGLEPTITAQPAAVLTPAVDLSVRYGVSERVDVGTRLGQSGLGLTVKVMITPRAWPVVLSVAPHVTGQLNVAPNLAITGPIVQLGLPLLVGVRLGTHQLVLGPRIELLAAGGGRRVVAVGSSLGVALRLSSAVSVLPEVAATAPLLSAGESVDDAFARLNGVLMQVRLSFLLGEELSAR